MRRDILSERLGHKSLEGTLLIAEFGVKIFSENDKQKAKEMIGTLTSALMLCGGKGFQSVELKGNSLIFSAL